MEKTTIIGFISNLLSDIREYNKLFDQYRQQLKGYDLKDHLQELTSDLSQATNFLQEMTTCLYRILNDSIRLIHTLNLNLGYTSQQITEANNNLIDIAGTCDSVNKRIHKLNDPNDLLVEIHKGFIDNLTTLNSSIVQYNNNQINKLYTIPQALEVFNRNSPTLISPR
jgi:chromosome segregation ATPase